MYKRKVKSKPAKRLTFGYKGLYIMQQIWKDIKGYQGLYQVSNKGRIKTTANHCVWNRQIIRKPKIRKYAEIPLKINGKSKWFMVHRLVAQAFIPNPQNKPQINHKDGNKLNNNVDNLQWCTPSENQIHKLYVLGYYNSDTFHNQYEKTSNKLKDRYRRIIHHATGTKWMHKNGKSIRVKEEQIEAMIDKGYRLGR